MNQEKFEINLQECKENRNRLVREYIAKRFNEDNIRYDKAMYEACMHWGLAEHTVVAIIKEKGKYVDNSKQLSETVK